MDQVVFAIGPDWQASRDSSAFQRSPRNLMVPSVNLPSEASEDPSRSVSPRRTYSTSSPSRFSIAGHSTPRLESMTTIPKEEMLKGIPVSMALGSFARLFGEGGDPVKNMAMSQRVDQLDDFISHNWVVPRFTKWSTLLLHYNVKPAWTAALATATCASFLVILGILPPLDSGVDGQRSLWGYLLGQLAFVVTLFFWQDVKRLVLPALRLNDRMAFVDKSCIHQTDKQKMLEGIRNLAGFLRKSDRLIVCCGPTYFRKLWTVYEIASFLSIHRDPSRIQLYPTTWAGPLALFTLGGLLLQLLAKAAGRLQVPYFGAFGMGALLLMWIYAYCMRQVARVHSAVKQDLWRFDIREAHCAVESDRPVVQANVSNFMRELGRVPERASEAECLDAFNKIVRGEFLSSVSSTRSELPFQLLFQFCGCLPAVLSVIDDCTEFVVFQEDGIKAIVYFIANLEFFHIIVLMGNVSLPLLSRQKQLRGWREALYILLVVLLGVFFYMPVAATLHFVSAPGEDARKESWERWCSVLLTLLCQACLLAITVWTSLRPGHCWCGTGMPRGLDEIDVDKLSTDQEDPVKPSQDLENPVEASQDMEDADEPSQRPAEPVNECDTLSQCPSEQVDVCGTFSQNPVESDSECDTFTL